MAERRNEENQEGASRSTENAVSEKPERGEFLKKRAS